MRIAIGSDHAGLELKQFLGAHLAAQGHDVVDCGCDSPDSCDYPDYGAAVGRAVAEGDAERGVLVCGTGIGISIAANKVAGVRAALVHDRFTTMMSRAHNDANIVAFGARGIDPKHARELLDVWLATEFEGGRHARRVGKIEAPELPVATGDLPATSPEG
ncbi:MAG: ribose 5-phosphate isomerase B [Planctomycetota bacterium]|jgi:ribose 5-phosphate isomerase B